MPDELTFREALHSVRVFHERVGAPVATKPCLLSSRPGEARFAALELITLARRLRERSEGNLDLVTSRVAFALEELADWAAAHDERSLVAAADAIGDRHAARGDLRAGPCEQPHQDSRRHERRRQGL